MTFFDNVGKVVGDAVGVIGGGRSQIDAAALSAKAGQVLQKARADVLQKLEKFGEKVGPQYGGDLFQAVAVGAQKTAQAAQDAEASKLFGISISQAKLVLIVVLVALAGYWLYKRRK